MSKLKFSGKPYYDDFDVSKGYYKVLFKPKKSIQIRELNQVQSVLGNQIEKFADHIFKSGSRVGGGSVRFEKNVQYVTLSETSVDFDKLQDKEIKGLSSGVTATVKTYSQRVVVGPSDIEDNTLYIVYTSAGTNGAAFQFSPGEILQVQDDTSYEVTSKAIGKGSLFSVSESTYYVYGQFVSCPAQTIVLGKYTTTPTYKVGLLINQSIVNSTDNSNLLDNAIGTDNYSAPGADRYEINLILSKKPIDYPKDDQFIDLGKITEGVLQEQVNRPQYSQIMDMIARRTYDESGDYSVRPFFLSIGEHPTDSTKYLGKLSDGKAYVKGHEIEKPPGSTVEIDKALVISNKSASVFVNYGNKMYLKATTGTLDPSAYIFDKLDIQPYGTGASQGTIYIKSFEYLGNDGTYDIYFINYFDVDFTFTYNNTDPLNNLYDVNFDNSLVFKFPVEGIYSVTNIEFTDNDENQISATLKTKTPTQTSLGSIIGTNPRADISLSFADAYELVSVYNNTTSEDITDRYTLHPNVNDNYYEYSFIRLGKYETAPAISDSLTITVKRYVHGNLTGQCFAKDSYVGVSHDEFPTYTSSKGQYYNLRDCLDFRPVKKPDGSFIELNEIPKQGTDITADISYYSDRKDILVLSDGGEFAVIKGDAYSYPKIPDNTMPVYKLDIKAYTSDPYEGIIQKYVDNKGYTMKSIGNIRENIEDVEYYVSLNLLDKQMSEIEVLDSNGNKRYKNGFITDNFTTINQASTNSNDYQAGVDRKNGILRPSFKRRNVKLDLDLLESNNYQITGDVITLPYSDIVFTYQQYASKTLSVNPYFIYAAEGQMSLSPSNDSWSDTITEPKLKVSIDTGVEAVRQLASKAGLTGTYWGEPIVSEEVLNSKQDTTISKTAGRKREGFVGGSGARDVITTTTTRTTSRIDTIKQTTTINGVKRDIEAKIIDNSLGTKVKDITLLPYMRSIDVQFYVSGLLKNTQFYAFFDDVDVNDDVRPINGAFGEPIISDETGSIVGVFRIPNEENKRFFVGSKKFRITNTSNNSVDPDELRSFAETQFHAGGVRQTKQESILSVATPEFSDTAVQTISSKQLSRSTVIDRSSSQTSQSFAVRPLLIGGTDPIAQSFYVQEEDGVFITKCDLYFSEKGENDIVWLELREMVNGYPSSKILPFGRVVKASSSVTTSTDSSKPTTFTFESPVYLQGNTEYCYVVGSQDKEYRLHISRLGGTDILTNQVISTQPHMGTVFKGQNNRTWNAEQYEDIKFTLYKAKFDISSDMVAAFNKSDEGTLEAMETNPFETTVDSYEIRIHHNNHGLSIGNKIKINMLEDNWFDMVVESGIPITGQTISGDNGSFTIKELLYVDEDSLTGYQNYKFKLTNLTGYFSDNESVTGEAYSETINDSKSKKHSISVIDNEDILNATLPTGIDNTFNGINLNELSKKAHTVTGVDSLDTFNITINEKATVTGRIGGDGNYIMPNIACEAIELNASIIDFSGTGHWYFDSIIHSGIGSNLQNDLALTDQAFSDNEFFELEYPIKMNTVMNDLIKYQDGNKSFTAYGIYESTNEDLSPVINISSIGITTYGNRIENNDSNTHLDWIDETDSLGFGSELAKYVTIPVQLEDPANIINIYMDVMKDQYSEIQVWYRVLPEQSYDSIIYQDWAQADYVQVDSINEFIETEINIPDGIGGELDNFKQFQIKIVMKSQNSAKIPKIKNLRCIALT